MACLKYLPPGPLPQEFANPWSGCSRFRRRVTLLAGSNYERINGKDGPSQGLVGPGQPKRSGGGILGEGNTKGQDTEGKISSSFFEEQ